MPKLQNNYAERLEKLVNNLQEEAPKSFEEDSLEAFRKMLSKPNNKRNDYNLELNSSGDTLLHIAARSNITKKNDIDFLVDEVGLDPNKRGKNKYTPLDSAIEAFGANVADAEAQGLDTRRVDSSVLEAVLEKSSLETIKNPGGEQDSAFHMLNDIRQINSDLYKTFADKLKGSDTQEKIGILNSKDANNESIFERLLLQKEFESFDKIYNTLSTNEQLEAVARGVSQRALEVCDKDELEFFTERFNKVSSQKINQSLKVDFKKSDAATLADMLEASIFINKDNPSYGSDERVMSMAKELQETGSLKGGVDQTLGENNSGESLINLSIVMNDKKSFMALSKKGADFNNEKKRLPIEAAIDSYGSSTYSPMEDSSKQILEETINRSDYKSILFAKRENRSKPFTFAEGLSLIMPTVVGTATSLNLLSTGAQGRDVPELAGKILDRAFELQPESIANFVSMRDSSGNTALHSFASKGDRSSLIRVLNQEGMTPDQKKQILELKNEEGKTPLTAASKHPDTQKYLQKIYDKADKDINNTKKSAYVGGEEPKKNKHKNSKKKSKNKINKTEIKQDKKQEAELELNAKPEPDLEDLVTKIYSLLKNTSKSKFPKDEFDSSRNKVNNYILEKEGGNFKVLDDALNEEYNYNTADTYRDKINAELKKFPQDKKVNKAKAWVDGTGGRPDPSLKKEKISVASGSSAPLIEQEPVLDKTQSPDLDKEQSNTLNETLSNQDEQRQVVFEELEKNDIEGIKSNKEKVPMPEGDGIKPKEATNNIAKDVSVEAKEDNLTSFTNKKLPTKVPVEEVSLQRNSKDSMSTLTTQQEKMDSPQEFKKSEISAFKAVEKNISSVDTQTEKSSNKNEQSNGQSVSYVEQSQYSSVNYAPIQAEFNYNNAPQVIQNQQYPMQYPVDTYAPIPVPMYNQNAEYIPQNFVQQQGFVNGYAADMYSQQPMPIQVPQQFMPQAQMFGYYNQAPAMNYAPYVDPYMQQYAPTSFMQYGYVDAPVNAYEQQQPQNLQSKNSGRNKDIESLKADEASLLKAAQAIRSERERMENEEKKSYSSSLSSRKSSSIKKMVEEGRKSPVQYAKQTDNERSAA